MARKGSPTISREDLYPSADGRGCSDRDDARLLDLDADEESPFLRGQKRVSVRRGPLPKKAVNGLKWAVLALVFLGSAGMAAAALYRYGERSWRFRIQSSDDIEITGTNNVTRAQVMEVLGGDIGRNIFFIPLGERKAQLEQIAWVESASVMRFIPHRLKVEIHERTPMAFARVGSHIALVDAGGTLMELPAGTKTKYSFPVLIGTNSGEPRSTRAARMRIYNELVRQLDAGGGHYAQDLSEVDLSDPDDVKIVANDPQGAVLVHLGFSNFLERYKVYVSHVREWRQQFEKLDSVDLRYDRQIIVNPDLRSASRQAPLSTAAVRIAASAGVQPAALTAHETAPLKAKTAPPPKPLVKPAVKKRAIRAHRSRHASRRAPVRNAAETVVLSPKVKTGASQPAAQTPTSTLNSTLDGTKAKKPSPAIPKEQEDQ
ncbi:MAG: peptide ABC transporter permease [Acidobacteria bacterium]|nr:MAG: peptide ABC transporter permease [Acidobacteriota bacterium]PYY09116.1 MAG: peptide ABC transporter permease [Acidobacteriota bacterium]